MHGSVQAAYRQRTGSVQAEYRQSTGRVQAASAHFLYVNKSNAFSFRFTKINFHSMIVIERFGDF